MLTDKLPQDRVDLIKKVLIKSFEEMLPPDTVVTQPYSPRNFFLPLLGKDYLNQQIIGSVSYTVRREGTVEITIELHNFGTVRIPGKVLFTPAESSVKIGTNNKAATIGMFINLVSASAETISDITNGLRLLTEGLYDDDEMRVTQRLMNNAVSMLSNYTPAAKMVQRTREPVNKPE